MEHGTARAARGDPGDVRAVPVYDAGCADAVAGEEFCWYTLGVTVQNGYPRFVFYDKDAKTVLYGKRQDSVQFKWDTLVVGVYGRRQSGRIPDGRSRFGTR